ncbi:MAG: tol-pal system YbgF family protein [Kordia sp.]|uniref:tetratricopeptide repeat protein n=1 Tax=Kordia sp. TaxID=1965332 RepID=UPI00385F55AC
MDTEEFIQNYIANRLSDAEKARAEELLKTDVEFQELYETHLELTSAFKISNDKALKKRFQQLDATETSIDTVKKFNYGMLRNITIAAIFIVGAFFAIDQFTGNSDVFDTYFETYPNTFLPVTRGTTDKDAQFEAFKAYESGNYAKAQSDFVALLKKTNNPNIRFYYAMSLLNQKEYDLALKELNNLTVQNFDYQIESLWYAALIQIKNKDFKNAKGNLQTIQKLNSTYKSEAIRTILARM